MVSIFGKNCPMWLLIDLTLIFMVVRWTLKILWIWSFLSPGRDHCAPSLVWPSAKCDAFHPLCILMILIEYISLHRLFPYWRRRKPKSYFAVGDVIWFDLSSLPNWHASFSLPQSSLSSLASLSLSLALHTSVTSSYSMFVKISLPPSPLLP